MPTQELESRVGKVEDAVGRLSADVRILSHDQVAVKQDIASVKSGVDKLLEREVARPSPMTWQTVAATCGGLAAVAAVVWWLIGSSPAVQDLDRRLTRLDDPDVGRVSRIEKDLGWAPRIVRAK